MSERQRRQVQIIQPIVGAVIYSSQALDIAQSFRARSLHLVDQVPGVCRLEICIAPPLRCPGDKTRRYSLREWPTPGKWVRGVAESEKGAPQMS